MNPDSEPGWKTMTRPALLAFMFSLIFLILSSFSNMFAWILVVVTGIWNAVDNAKRNKKS